MKENLKPRVYKLRERERARPRTFCRTVRRAARAGKVKGQKARSRREAESEQGVQSACAGPKPGDLSMSRLKTP